MHQVPQAGPLQRLQAGQEDLLLDCRYLFCTPHKKIRTGGRVVCMIEDFEGIAINGFFL